MELLSSRDNTLIKNCRSLAADARTRREQGRVFLEGLRLCADAAAAGVPPETLLLTQSALTRWEDRLAPLLAAADHTVLITDQLAEQIADTQSPQGVFAICHRPSAAAPNLTRGGRYLLLDRLQDPGNLGTILRCAEAFAVDWVILSRDCADLWSPKVLRSTMGSAFRQPVWETDSLTQTVATLRGAGVPVYCAALDSTAVTPAALVPGSAGIAVVVGNEGSGVSPAVQDSCTAKVYIPMTPAIESLNAATAAAILLWEMSGRGAAH